MAKKNDKNSEKVSTLVLCRHGLSIANEEHWISGTIDVDLSRRGAKEVTEQAQRLKGITFNMAFSSKLKRSQKTLLIILKGIGQENIPVKSDAALNERHFGLIEGMNIDKAVAKYGKDTIYSWRYITKPPKGESMEDKIHVVVRFYKKNIIPQIKKGANILIVAHGGSLRGIVMMAEGLTLQEARTLPIDNSAPIIYKIDSDLHMISKTSLDMPKASAL